MDQIAVHDRSSPEAKIALFRSLFRGRDDVYSRRFEGRISGKSGYSPVCANEWARGSATSHESSVRPARTSDICP